MSLTTVAEGLYLELNEQFTPSDPTSPNLPVHQAQRIGSLLLELKISLAQSSLLLPNLTDLQSVNFDSLAKARHILEIGAFHSIRTHDIPAFERYIAQLGPYYNDYRSILQPSEFRYPLIGLNLLRLLTQNKIAQFHTILEGLVKEDGQKMLDILQSNRFITHPIDLERWLMEGSYSKVWMARNKVAIPEYRYFVDLLMNTIRNEIASCEEKAYNSLPLNDAGTLLFFRNQGEVLEFARSRKWRVDPTTQTIHFTDTDQSSKNGIAMEKVVENTLVYAKELETIV